MRSDFIPLTVLGITFWIYLGSSVLKPLFKLLILFFINPTHHKSIFKYVRIDGFILNL